MLKSVLILFSFGLFASLLPLAAGAKTLGESWPEIIDELQKQGIHRVGDFDLDDFSKDAKNISWLNNKKGAPSIVSGSRTSAFYIVSTKEVYVSPLPQDTMSSLADLELHEALGALNYEDNQYTLSTGLRLLLETKSPDNRDKLLKKFSKDLFNEKNLKLMREGGSSVGGGGDIRVLLIKNRVLNEILRSTHEVSMSFLSNFPQINFEPVSSKTMDYVSIKYMHRSKAAIENIGPYPRVPIKNGMQELITFVIPVDYWEKGPRQRKLLITEIKNKILGFYPAEASYKKTMILPVCRGEQKIVVPYTTDRDVISVQINRGGYMKNCDPMIQYAGELTAPSLPQDAFMPEPGKVYYDCTYSKGPASQNQLVALNLGRSMRYMVDLDLSETFHISAFPDFDESGKFVSVRLLREEDGKKTYGKPKEITAKDDSISFQYKNETYKFTCKRR